jgi:hypothetical protein
MDSPIRHKMLIFTEESPMSENPSTPEAPIGLLMELARRPKAMNRYAMMTPQEQQQVIQKARRVRSKEEMAELADILI